MKKSRRIMLILSIIAILNGCGQKENVSDKSLNSAEYEREQESIVPIEKETEEEQKKEYDIIMFNEKEIRIYEGLLYRKEVGEDPLISISYPQVVVPSDDNGALGGKISSNIRKIVLEDIPTDWAELDLYINLDCKISYEILPVNGKYLSIVFSGYWHHLAPIDVFYVINIDLSSGEVVPLEEYIDIGELEEYIWNHIDEIEFEYGIIAKEAIEETERSELEMEIEEYFDKNRSLEGFYQVNNEKHLVDYYITDTGVTLVIFPNMMKGRGHELLHIDLEKYWNTVENRE